jgi:phage terminase large subunit-like protein
MARKKTPPNASLTDRTTAYAQAVLAGDIVAGPHVRNACRRHIEDLERGQERGLWFDREAALHVFNFFEQVLCLSEGQFEGRPFELHPSQAFIIGSLFGWKRADGTRRFRRAYIEQGKGNGKSPLAGGIGLFGLTGDGEAGAQIYAAASRKDQADILFRDAVKMRNQSPALAKRLHPSGGPGREYNLAFIEKGSFFRPISREAGKTGSGPRPHFALCDEVHEHPDRSIMEMLERGFKFRRQPLLFMITNSGSDRNSVCWEEHEHAIRVASGNRDAKDDDPAYVGEVLDDTTFAFVCSLDPGDDPLTDPSCWAKANPLLGVTITEQWLSEQVAQARAMPGKLNGILRLHFCVWTDAETAWMTREALEPCLAEFDPEVEHAGSPVCVGVDLSGTQDLTAIAYVVRAGELDGKPTFDVWCEVWTPEGTMAARALRDKADYPRWAGEGHILTTPGRLVDFRHVAMRLADAASAYEISAVAYDRYAYGRFEAECEDLGLTLNHVEHPQGGKKKGKAINESGAQLWMPGSVKIVEEAILEGRVRFKSNPVVIMALMSAVTETDPWGNYWLTKRKSVNRIDPAVAICMAMGAAMAGECYSAPTSPWDDPNFLLVAA